MTDTGSRGWEETAYFKRRKLRIIQGGMRRLDTFQNQKAVTIPSAKRCRCLFVMLLPKLTIWAVDPCCGAWLTPVHTTLIEAPRRVSLEARSSPSTSNVSRIHLRPHRRRSTIAQALFDFRA